MLSSSCGVITASPHRSYLVFSISWAAERLLDDFFFLPVEQSMNPVVFLADASFSFLFSSSSLFYPDIASFPSPPELSQPPPHELLSLSYTGSLVPSVLPAALGDKRRAFLFATGCGPIPSSPGFFSRLRPPGPRSQRGPLSR